VFSCPTFEINLSIHSDKTVPAHKPGKRNEIKSKFPIFPEVSSFPRSKLRCPCFPSVPYVEEYVQEKTDEEVMNKASS
jgi:hypothetical protein